MDKDVTREDIHAEPLKVAKTYDHVSLLLARILRRRKLHSQSVADRFLKCGTDPKQIAPTIAMKGQPPATSALVQEGLARKQKKMTCAVMILQHNDKGD